VGIEDKKMTGYSTKPESPDIAVLRQQFEKYDALTGPSYVSHVRHMYERSLYWGEYVDEETNTRWQKWQNVHKEIK